MLRRSSGASAASPAGKKGKGNAKAEAEPDSLPVCVAIHNALEWLIAGYNTGEGHSFLDHGEGRVVSLDGFFEQQADSRFKDQFEDYKKTLKSLGKDQYETFHDLLFGVMTFKEIFLQEDDQPKLQQRCDTGVDVDPSKLRLNKGVAPGFFQPVGNIGPANASTLAQTAEKRLGEFMAAPKNAQLLRFFHEQFIESETLASQSDEFKSYYYEVCLPKSLEIAESQRSAAEAAESQASQADDTEAAGDKRKRSGERAAESASPYPMLTRAKSIRLDSQSSARSEDQSLDDQQQKDICRYLRDILQIMFSEYEFFVPDLEVKYRLAFMVQRRQKFAITFDAKEGELRCQMMLKNEASRRPMLAVINDKFRPFLERHIHFHLARASVQPVLGAYNYETHAGEVKSVQALTLDCYKSVEVLAAVKALRDKVRGDYMAAIHERDYPGEAVAEGACASIFTP